MEVEYEAGGRLCRLGGYSASWWRSKRPTWDQLLALEPGLAVAEAAVAFDGRPLRSAEWRTVEAMLAKHVGLFGANALDPVLGEMTAYDAALQHLRGVSDRLRRPPRWCRRRRW